MSAASTRWMRMCDLLLVRGPARQPGHERAVARDGCTTSSFTRWACSARTRRSSVPSHRLARMARIRACSASSCASERLLGLEEAVRKMTSAPAARLGLSDRGRLADGLLADVVIFDPATVGLKRDLRRAAPLPDRDRLRDRQRHARRRSGEHTGALPGRAIRR